MPRIHLRPSLFRLALGLPLLQLPTSRGRRRRGGRAPLVARAHLCRGGVRGEALRSGPLDLGWGGLTTVEDSPGVEDAKDIVRYDTASGEGQVLVPASRLQPDGAEQALEIDDYAWSEDGSRLLVFTNTKKVWRRNTRGDYWVLELDTGALRQLGGAAAPSTLMFAKLSPDGTRAAYVRENDLWVEELASGELTRLTADGSETSINGTSDWVYEEEFDLRDAFRRSPDGREIAFWHFDSSGVGGADRRADLAALQSLAAAQRRVAGRPGHGRSAPALPRRG